MADYPNYSTTPVVQTVSGTGWTIDVTSLALDTDLSVIDFAVYQTFNGDRIPLSSLQKTSSTTITYVGASMAPDTEVVAMRSTPLSRYQSIRYASEFKSFVYNSEIDNIYTLLAEYTQLSKFLLENFILHPVPILDEFGWLQWDLDGDGEPDAEIPPVNIRGPVGIVAQPQPDPPYTDVSQLPTPSQENVGHGYIINGVLYISDGTQWISFGQVEGRSAYQIWLSEGNSGTIQDYLDSLRGLSAYEVWIAEGNSGTPQDYLNTLVGKGLQLDGTVGTAGDLPTNPVVPENQIYIVQDTKEFYISNGDGTWTNLGVLYTPIPIWINETELSWDLTGDGIADTQPVQLAGPGVPPGGEAGQLLNKVSGTDFDTEWIDRPFRPFVVRKVFYDQSNNTNPVAGNHLFIPGTMKIFLRAAGGGGGGGMIQVQAFPGGGGGEGELLEILMPNNLFNISSTVSFTRGLGGEAGVNSSEFARTGTDGGDGGDSTIVITTGAESVTFVAKGGKGGFKDASGGLGGRPLGSLLNVFSTPGQNGQDGKVIYSRLSSSSHYFPCVFGGLGGGVGGQSRTYSYGGSLWTTSVIPALDGYGGGGSGAGTVVNADFFDQAGRGSHGGIAWEWLEYVS